MSSATGPSVPLCQYADPLIRKLRRRLPAALGEWNPKAIHDARVSTRRLRAALDLLEPAVPGKLIGPLRRTLRRLRRRLGPLRDFDVMLARLDALAHRAKHAAAATWARDRLIDERTSARRKAGKKRSADKLLQRLDAWTPLRQHVIDLGDVVAGLMVASLRSQWEAFVAMSRQFDLFRPQDPHELRIAAKHLRYTFEMLGYTSSAASPVVVRSFKRIQDALGDWHDHVVLAEWMMRLSADQMLAHHDPAMQKNVLAMTDLTLRRADRALRRFATLWRKDGPALSEMVGAIVSESQMGRGRGDSDESIAPQAGPTDASSAA